MKRLFAMGSCVAVLIALSAYSAGPASPLRFEITVAPGLLAKPTDGRLLVVLGKGEGEPRQTIGRTGMMTPPVLGADVDGFAPGIAGVVDGRSEIFPIESLDKFQPG